MLFIKERSNARTKIKIKAFWLLLQTYRWVTVDSFTLKA